jgi:iron complex transport system substrate-binding protein
MSAAFYSCGADVRIVSLFPAATEIVVELGLANLLVGISHACPRLAELADVPRLSRFRGPDNATAGEIDRAVRQMVEAGEPLYEFDRELFLSLQPDIVLIQSLCHVCAIDENSLATLMASSGAEVWESSPRTVAEILQGVESLGTVLGCRPKAEALAASVSQRLEGVKVESAQHPMKRVAFLEWLDPLFAAGHWIPELVQIAGGHDLLGTIGERSLPIEFNDLAEADPELIVIGCCGWSAERTASELEKHLVFEDWQSLRAVKSGRIHVVDAESRFTSPGISIADAAEELANLFHSTDFSAKGP